MKTIRHLRGVWKGKKKEKSRTLLKFCFVTGFSSDYSCLGIRLSRDNDWGVSGMALGTYFWEKLICIQLGQLLQSCMSVVEVKLGA